MKRRVILLLLLVFTLLFLIGLKTGGIRQRTARERSIPVREGGQAAASPGAFEIIRATTKSPKPVGQPASVLELRSDPRFQRAIATFDSIEMEKIRFPTNRNARGRLGDLQQKLFFDDCATMAAHGVLNCEDRGELFEMLQRSSGGPWKTNTSSQGEIQFEAGLKLKERYAYLSSAGNSSFSNVLQVLETRGDVDPFRNQLFLECLFYSGYQTYIRSQIVSERRHVEAFRNNLKELPHGNPAEKSEEYAKSVDDDLQELISLADAYRSVFQKRFERDNGGDWAQLMDRFEQIELNATGSELAVPCP
jgi:hypothetical protein